jgi:hypothetical protein
MGENCTSACISRDHASWGECVKAKGLRIGYANSAGGQDLTAQKKFDKNLDAYRAARAQGIQPAGTDRASVDRALALSDVSGTAFQA